MDTSLFKQLIAIHFEQAKRRKAIREMSRLNWSYDFLCEVVRKAAKDLGRGIEIEIESPGGDKLRIRSTAVDNKYMADDDIFNHLDDNAAIDRFVAEHAPRR